MRKILASRQKMGIAAIATVLASAMMKKTATTTTTTKTTKSVVVPFPDSVAASAVMTTGRRMTQIPVAA